MSEALFDVNVLLALLDPYHTSHEKAQCWFADFEDALWATCPITQNGYIRIVTQSAYPNYLSLAEAIDLLDEFTRHPSHRFWAADRSLLDPSFCTAIAMPSGRHSTDTYLLALARSRSGLLITLDRRLFTAAVIDGADTVCLIG